MVRGRPWPIVTDYIEVPPELRELNKNVTISADVMFVNGLGFLLTMSRGIRFITQQFMPTRTAPLLGSAINDVTNFYNSHSFNVTTCIADGEFE